MRRKKGCRFISPGSRLRYFVNNLLIRNPLWQILSLVVISVLIILLGMVLVNDLTQDAFWWSFTRLLDQGTFINDNCDPHLAVVGVIVTIGGIMVLSLLIGIFSSKITEQLDSLKRGRTPVLEEDHYIVCGSGDRIYEVTRELLKAVEEDSIHGRIVIFSRSSREEVEEILLQRLGRKSVKRVICRSGNTADVDALTLPCFQRCAGFVLVGDDDADIIKTLVAVNSLKGENHPVGVCELRNAGKQRIAEMAYHDIHWLPVREIVMRLLVQVCRQPGLSSVYSEILSFRGNEFYLAECPDAGGCSFGSICGRVRGGVVIGVSSNGEININPPPDTEISGEDSLLILAKNSSSFHFTDEAEKSWRIQPLKPAPCREPLKMLIFSGGSSRFGFMLGLLDKYAMEGGEILVAGSLLKDEGAGQLARVKTRNCSLEYRNVDRTDPDQVRALSPEKFDSIMVISGRSPGMTDEEADSQCIVNLLILRNIADELGDHWSSTVVSEIRNPRNRRLATASGIDDFVISNEVCSMIMAQLVLEPGLGQLYEEIFDPRGCEIQLRNRISYESRIFHELALEGLGRREIVLGWLTGSGEDARVNLNPPREEQVPSKRDTRIVVIAER